MTRFNGRVLAMVWGAVCAFATSGCAVQLASGAGISAAEGRAPRGKWHGNASGSFVGSSTVSPQLGLELDGRHEYEHGTTWHAGAQVGVIKNPGAGSRVGMGAHVDFGTPLSDPSLFPDGDFYVGVTMDTIVWLGGDRGPNELNASPWMLVGQPEFVFRLRYRSHHHFDDDPQIGHEAAHDFETGVGLRIRFMSEYF